MLYREAGQFKTSYSADMAMFPIRQDRIALIALLVLAFLGVPLLAAYHIWPLGSDYMLRAILIPFLILSLAAIGVNILVGYCGQISLGSGAFMAIGAYSAYKFGTGVHLPFEWLGTELAIPRLPVLPSILLGGLMAAIVGILFGIPSLRIKGLYLAVATLAAQFFFDWVFIRVKWFTNYAPSGSVSAPELDFFGLVVNSSIERYLLCLVFVVVFALLAKNLVRGNLGRQWMAIRDMDIAAELMGIRPFYAKLTAFAVSSFIVGVAGRPVGVRLPRRLGAAGVRHQPLAAAPVHGDHRRAWLDPRLVPGGGLHPDHSDHAEPRSDPARRADLDRDHHASGVHHLRLADLLSSDQGAARLRPAVGDRQGEAEALAVSVLGSREWGVGSREYGLGAAGGREPYSPLPIPYSP